MGKERNPDLKIVVVDDSDFSRSRVVEILESEGFSIVGNVGSAKKAIEYFSSSSANLFIIDVVMPEISGIEVAKFISDQNSDIFVIMISSLNTESTIIEAITTGAVDFLPKPLNKELLISAVEKVESRMEKN